MAYALLVLFVVVLVAFVPSLWYLVRVRNWERFGREPYRRLLVIFVYGAVVAVIISVVLEVLLLGNLHNFRRIYELGDESFLGAVVVAPVVEELAKAAGLVIVMAHFQREEDGIVYGIAAGLGFAATENLLYESAALSSAGVIAYVATAFLRTISSTLLHASATGVTGLGFGKAKVDRSPYLTILPYYLIAVAMHAVFNFVAGLDRTHPSLFGSWTPLVSLLVLILFAGFAFAVMRDRIGGESTTR